MKTTKKIPHQECLLHKTITPPSTPNRRIFSLPPAKRVGEICPVHICPRARAAGRARRPGMVDWICRGIHPQCGGTTISQNISTVSAIHIHVFNVCMTAPGIVRVICTETLTVCRNRCVDVGVEAVCFGAILQEILEIFSPFDDLQNGLTICGDRDLTIHR
jgi:hypothetical protein